MVNLLIALGVVAALMLMAYLAASGGAGRWLPMREWLARTSCSHTHGVLIAIQWDGVAVYKCTGCGKHIGKPL